MGTSWAAVAGVARANAERVVIWGVVLLLVAVTGIAWYGSTSLHGSDASIESVRDDERVSLTRQTSGYVLEPTAGESTAGLVFYPGGHVSPDAYLASLAPLAIRANVEVYVPQMPVGLAVFDPDAASNVVAAHPNVDRWFVGGHSLGGVMACRYANGHRDQVDGLILFAAYCEAGGSPPVPTMSVTGSNDTVLDRKTYRDRRMEFPPDAKLVEIRGMNHSEFGSYTGQPGDRPAPIGYRTAHGRLADVTVPWFENHTTRTALSLVSAVS